MSVITNVKTPENTLNYMKYVEIENDSRYPAVTGGQGQGVFNKSAILVQPINPLNIGGGNGTSGQDYIEKFGSNLSVGANMETIWEPGGIYDYLTVASTVSAISDDSGDTAAGTGVRSIEIQGLDANYNTITEVISTNGTSAGPASTNEFLRIYRAIAKTVGTAGTNEGTVNINAGGTTVISIGTYGTGGNKEGFGQSQTSVYTVPAGKTGYITQWSVGSSVYNSGVQAFLMVGVPNDGPVMRIKDVMFLNNYSIKDYKMPLRVTEKSDIEVRAYDSSTGIPVSTSYNVILVDNV
jgi:hypothetical protein